MDGNMKIRTEGIIHCFWNPTIVKSQCTRVYTCSTTHTTYISPRQSHALYCSISQPPAEPDALVALHAVSSVVSTRISAGRDQLVTGRTSSALCQSPLPWFMCVVGCIYQYWFGNNMSSTGMHAGTYTFFLCNILLEWVLHHIFS